MAGTLELGRTVDLSPIDHLDFEPLCQSNLGCGLPAEWVVELRVDPCGAYRRKVLCDKHAENQRGFCASCGHFSSLFKVEHL
jgi:hypothetical protein